MPFLPFSRTRFFCLVAGAAEQIAAEHPAEHGLPPAVRGEGGADGGRPQVVRLWPQVSERASNQASKPEDDGFDDGGRSQAIRVRAQAVLPATIRDGGFGFVIVVGARGGDSDPLGVKLGTVNRVQASSSVVPWYLRLVVRLLHVFVLFSTTKLSPAAAAGIRPAS